MRTVLKRLALTGAFLFTPLAALADDVALILSGSDYRRISDVNDASKAQSLVSVLRDRGFRVFSGSNMDADDSWKLVESFRTAAKTADRVFVMVAGHVVSTKRETWLLTRFARSPSDLSIGHAAVPMQPIMDIAKSHPAQAIVMIAPSRVDLVLETGVTAGASSVPAPQGVTLVKGPVADLVEAARSVLSQNGESLEDALADVPRRVKVSGFVTDAFSYLPRGNNRDVDDTETEFWRASQSIGTHEAYQAYLDRYPYGRYNREAADAIDELRNDPERLARLAEDALGLSRDQRRSIQRHLSILGFDPRGIDGVFGAGSRAAIRDWQNTQGIVGNGYLTGNQIASLDQSARNRAIELAEEAERRRAKLERLDTTYWRETGRNGGEGNLRAYLERYPDGLYASVAQIQLDAIEDAKRAALAAEERKLWDEVRSTNTIKSYQRYLARYPDGAFADASKSKIAILRSESNVGARAAAAAEKQVAGTVAARLLVENRLKALGYEVGKVDGKFDKAARRAIRRFQNTRELPVTGFVSQTTMVHLLIAR